MKTFYNLINKSLLPIILLLAGTDVIAQEGYYIISGTVKDKNTRKTIEYATVSITDKNIGTVSNADGDFLIKIPESINASSVDFSCIGYATFRFPVKGESVTGLDIRLDPIAAMLSAVIIQAWDVDRLLREAINKIEKNYSSSPTMVTGFYRETMKKKRNYINVSEAVVDVYKTAYTENIERDRVQIVKGRKLLSHKKTDTLSVNLLGGPTLSVFMDIVKNLDVLLDRETFPYLTFSMGNATQIDGRDQYVISFRPQVRTPEPLFSGSFFINKESMAFTRAEYTLDMSDRNKVTSMILKKKPTGLRFRPEELSYVVSYREQNGKTYLSYIRSEMKFKCDWKRKLFSTNYDIVSEMAVTDIVNQNVSAISRKEAFLPNQSLGDRVANFHDDDFWGAYNIIEPDESLESGVAKLKKQYR